MRLYFDTITPEDFLRRFIPAPTGTGSVIPIPDFEGVFSEMVTNTSKNIMHKKFIKCVEARNLCPNFKLIDTPSPPDASFSCRKKVDLCIFDASVVEDASRPVWGYHVMHAEFKNCKAATSGDPFVDDCDTTDIYEDDGSAARRQYARSQIVAYAAEYALRQQHMFFFTFIILGDDARLIRWDRAGAVVTHRFNYRNRPELAMFLWRFPRLSNLQQGYDPTANRIDFDHPLIKQAIATQLDEHRDYIRQMFQRDIEADWPRYKLTVTQSVAPSTGIDGAPAIPSDQSGEDSLSAEAEGQEPLAMRNHQFIVGRPHFRNDDVVGRATRGYVALNVETMEFVWLKDVWRIRDLHKEGDVIYEMNEAQVPNVPTLVCHGDVEDQRTLTDKLLENKVQDRRMKGYIHYRLVVREVARPLWEFENGQELVQILGGCLLAHHAAYERLSILHRDVSDGNILIVFGPHRDGEPGAVGRRGMLTNWAVCKKVLKHKDWMGVVRGHEQARTGTWEFISASLLGHPTKSPTWQDDLESFFRVLLFFAVRFLRNDCPDVANFVRYFFNECTIHNGRSLGGSGKCHAFMCENLWIWETPWSFLGSPLDDLIAVMLYWFHHYYRVENARTDAEETLAKSKPNPSEALFLPPGSNRSRCEVENGRINAEDALAKRRSEDLRAKAGAINAELLANSNISCSFKWHPIAGSSRSSACAASLEDGGMIKFPIKTSPETSRISGGVITVECSDYVEIPSATAYIRRARSRDPRRASPCCGSEVERFSETVIGRQTTVSLYSRNRLVIVGYTDATEPHSRVFAYHVPIFPYHSARAPFRATLEPISYERSRFSNRLAVLEATCIISHWQGKYKG